MADPSELDERPQKRARLDEPTWTSESALLEAPQTPPKSTPSTSVAPIAPITSSDSDLERELRAGITEYVSPENLGFTGTLKQRYTDFLVNEILPSGEVLHLKSMGVQKKEGKRNGVVKEGERVKKEDVIMKDVSNGAGVEQPSVEEDASADVKPEVKKVEDGADEEAYTVPAEDLEALEALLGEDVTLRVVSLAKSIRKHPHWKAKDFTAVKGPIMTDKDKRTWAHQTLRRIFPNMLESAMEPDQSIRIKARPPAERGNKRKRGNDRDRNQEQDRRRGQLGWEELGGEFLHFTLYKENKDTMEVVGFLGSMTGGGPKSYGFAGTKDRRACTVQRVCVKRQTAERLAGIGKKLFNAAIGDYEYKHHDLSLGDLMGNQFVISLRDCHFEKEEGLDFAQRLQLANNVLSQTVKDFEAKGFINYYGLQRFGSFSASTDAVGIKLLQGNLKGAVDDILAYSEVALAAAKSTEANQEVLVSQDDKARAKALHHWKAHRKGQDALDILPRKFSAERNIIQHLSSKNSRTRSYDRLQDWQGALMAIPRGLRLMYVHAYQSLVWNVVAGKRWTMFGDKIVEGDLVLVHEHKDKEHGQEKAEKDTIDQDGEIIINPAGADSSIKDEDAFERARPLSKEEAESGNYKIFDVVLPQPGFDVEYPRNAIGDFYKELMGSERGGGLDPHNMRRKWREISLSGGYRKFIARPLQPMSFEVKEYTKVDKQLVETDLQRLQKRKQDDIQGSAADKKKESKIKPEADEGEMAVDEQKKIALILSLQLGSSQYATMALRELMKAGGVKAFKPEFMGGR